MSVLPVIAVNLERFFTFRKKKWNSDDLEYIYSEVQLSEKIGPFPVNLSFEKITVEIINRKELSITGHNPTLNNTPFIPANAIPVLSLSDSDSDDEEASITYDLTTYFALDIHLSLLV